ncbi:hypothetical protein [Massilia litorea]|uniref:Transmembrane protein n=1 Tax=Massilia litorea TaxID=2769491 RepID=A0A7L9U2B0_9BURK|nr:hypothetical protein [Massilia litorea]QOL48146.1 hypothetical protein LPB04_14200 [Massilia litorea]
MIDTDDTAFRLPLRKLGEAKAMFAAVAPHRSLARAPFDTRNLATGVCIAFVLWALLLAAQPLLIHQWTQYIGFWLKALGLPAGTIVGASQAEPLHQLLAPLKSAIPSPEMLFGALAFGGAAWFAAGRLEGRLLPIKYLLRSLCVILLLSILVLLVWPESFAYSLEQHAGDLMTNGYRCLLVFPFMLGVGYHLFDERLVVKLLYSLAIETYFIVMIPHKIILHIVALHFGTRLSMPLLYVCLGSAFDVLVFVALYAWALSNLPPQHHSM